MRLKASEKVKRDLEIILDRKRGLSWVAIAEKHGVGARQAQNIYKSGVSTSFQIDVQEEIRVAIERFESVIEDFAEVAQTATNDSAKVGALKGKLAAVEHKLTLMQAVGLLPKNLGRLAVVRVSLNGEITDEDGRKVLADVGVQKPVAVIETAVK